MGLWKRLTGSEPKPLQRVTADPAGTEWLDQATRFGDIRIDVVGESFYQPAIRAACSWKPGADTFHECMAELVPEPTNEHDPNCIRVEIDGQLVGHLSRADAIRLGPSVRAGIAQQGSGMCRAVIAGHAGGETENLGVFLHLDATVI